MLTFEHSVKTLRELKHGLFYLICRRRGQYTSDFSVLVSREDHTICDVTSYVAVALGLRLIDKVNKSVRHQQSFPNPSSAHFVIRFNPGENAAGELEQQYAKLGGGTNTAELAVMTRNGFVDYEGNGDVSGHCTPEYVMKAMNWAMAQPLIPPKVFTKESWVEAVKEDRTTMSLDTWLNDQV